MSTVIATKPWDFSQALELLKTDLSGPAPHHHSITASAGRPATCPTPKSNGSDDLHDSRVEEAVGEKDFAAQPSSDSASVGTSQVFPAWTHSKYGLPESGATDEIPRIVLVIYMYLKQDGSR
jgi:hypothetical protein